MYHEYNTQSSGISKRHDNGRRVSTGVDIAEMLRRDQERRRENIQTLAASLVELMGEDEYFEFLAPIPDDYNQLIKAMQAKLLELTQEAVSCQS